VRAYKFKHKEISNNEILNAFYNKVLTVNSETTKTIILINNTN